MPSNLTATTTRPERLSFLGEKLNVFRERRDVPHRSNMLISELYRSIDRLNVRGHLSRQHGVFDGKVIELEIMHNLSCDWQFCCIKTIQAT